MRLVACGTCHAQYDVETVAEPTIACPCGESVSTRAHPAVDAPVERCSACGALLPEKATNCAYCGADAIRDARLTGPVCPECYARNRDAARFCTSCGVRFRPQPIRTRSEPLSCPVCPDVTLRSRSVGGTWVEECGSCAGLWVPGDGFNDLVERALERRTREGGLAPGSIPPRKATWQTSVVYRHCPECGGTMQRKNFARRSGVIVDWCGHHGTWLDADEVEDIAAFILAGGLERQAAAGGGAAPWQLPADAERLEGRLEAERLLARERVRARGGWIGWEETSTGSVLRGLGDLLSHFLDG